MGRGPDRRTLLTGAAWAVLAGGLATGCARSGPASGAQAGAVPTAAGVDVPRRRLAPADVPDLPQVVAGLVAFAGDLHRVSATSQRNWTSSPLSIAAAFGMLRAGARAGTARSLDDVLHFPAGTRPEGDVHAALNALAAELVTTGPVDRTPLGTAAASSKAPAPVVAVANGVFVDRDLQVQLRPAYLTLLAREYGARVSTVSFDGPAATKAINRWVAEQTRDRIRTLFDEIERDAALVLANAVYLKAVWAQQFDRSSTRPGSFATPGGRGVTVPVMREALQDVAYTRTAAWERVTLPYLGGELAMRIVLPTRVVADAAQLTPLLRDATAPTAGDRRRTVSLTLPRWDARTRLDLKPALHELGLVTAFDGTADFSGIVEGGDLFVGQARHVADVTVDEAGTEAAAATGISMRVVGAIPPGVSVTVDRPFVWAVVHEPTGTPLFTGHVVDPSIGR